MNDVSVVIIEDEIPAARLLCSMVKRLRPTWKSEVLHGSIAESVKWFAANPHPDLIFLDIQLADGNSFDFLARAKPSSVIIFTTAYDEYAIRAFSVNSIDYILKPIDERRLTDAIVKYETMAQLNTIHSGKRLENIFDTLSVNNKKYRTRFLISGIDKLWTLQVDDTAYFYSTNRVTVAVTFDDIEHVIDITLDKLMEQLDPDKFFRANRQTIININSVKKIEPYFNGRIVVVTKPQAKETITISKEKAGGFKTWLNF